MHFDTFDKIFFKNLTMMYFNVEKINTHGGSLRVYLCNSGKYKQEKICKQILKSEKNEVLKNCHF